MTSIGMNVVASLFFSNDNTTQMMYPKDLNIETYDLMSGNYSDSNSNLFPEDSFTEVRKIFNSRNNSVYNQYLSKGDKIKNTTINKN